MHDALYQVLMGSNYLSVPKIKRHVQDAATKGVDH